MRKSFLLLLTLPLLACTQTVKEVEAEAVKKSYHGKATWYQSGKRTADGQRFDPNKYSVAHRTLPFGTMLRLTNVQNGKQIEAVVNDRGPFIRDKEVDVSRGGAQALGFFHSGTARLLIEVLDRQNRR